MSLFGDLTRWQESPVTLADRGAVWDAGFHLLIFPSRDRREQGVGGANDQLGHKHKRSIVTGRRNKPLHT